MADIKVDQRQIAQPSAPDISGAGNVYANLGATGKAVFSAIGEYAKEERKTKAQIEKNNLAIEEKTLYAGASTSLQRLQLQYAADPNLSMQGVEAFQKEAQAITEGTLQAANPEYAAKLQLDLNTTADKLTTRLLGESFKVSLANEKRDISLAINELQTLLATQINDGNLVSAAQTNDNLTLLLQSLGERGVSAKQLIDVAESTEVIKIAAQTSRALQNAQTAEQRADIMKEMNKLPDTPVNNKAFNVAWTEFNRLNKLYQEGEDLSVPLNNVITGQSYLNTTLPAGQANKIVDLYAKNISNTDEPPREMPVPTDTYQALPAYKDQPMTFDFEEDIRAGNEGRQPYRYAVQAVVQTEEAETKREPSLYELAEAHAKVGSANATKFPNEVKNRLYAGNGAQAFEAVTALSYVDQIAPATIDLDTETDILYTEFKMGIAAGRTDYDQLILDARNTVIKASKTDLKVNNDLFNQQFSLSGNAPLKNLNNQFKEATGVDALKTGSTKSLTDYYHVLKNAYLASDGNLQTATESARRQMVRVHGEDRFSPAKNDISVGIISGNLNLAPLASSNSDKYRKVLHPVYASGVDGFQYVRFPPTKILAGLNDLQINNMLTQQLVFAAQANKNIKLESHYSNIKTASEDALMEKNFAYPAPSWSKDSLTANPANYITQHIEGIGDVEGRVFLKSNNLTVQNDTGRPVWEVWMQDRQGREFPVIDERSPYNNIMLFEGYTAKEFVPQWAASKDQEELEKVASKYLADEGKKLYSVFDWNPLTIADNYRKRKAYVEELGNIEKSQEKIGKILGISPKEKGEPSNG